GPRMPPVQLVSVNELAGDENENCQARWSAAVNEWRTELGEAGTTGRYGKVVDDYATTSVKTTWNGFRGLPKKTKKTMQQQERVCNALRPTVDNIVAVITESRTIGDLFANFHAIRMVEELSGGSRLAGRTRMRRCNHSTLHVFSRCLTLIRAASFPLAESVALFREIVEPAGVDLQPPDTEFISPFVHEAAGDLATATATYYKRELLRYFWQNAKLELGTKGNWSSHCARAVLSTVCATVGSKLTAKKRRAVEACLRCKLEEFEVDVDRNGQQKKGRKAASPRGARRATAGRASSRAGSRERATRAGGRGGDAARRKSPRCEW
ncbi:hypothetical protein APUTEX25_005787, partial [Auxenochlorella protothecoides]